MYSSKNVLGSSQRKTNVRLKEHTFVCVLICVLFLKVCSFARFDLTVHLFCLQPQPNQMLIWQKNTLLNTLIEKAHK